MCECQANHEFCISFSAKLAPIFSYDGSVDTQAWFSASTDVLTRQVLKT